MIKNRIKSLPRQTYIGCPMTKNRSPWCFRMCAPDAEGRGRCGRIAPHSIRSRIQIGIDQYKSDMQKCPANKN